MLRLKELREKRRLNQEGLAIKLHVSQSTVSAYEVGERTPDLSTLITIANLFDVSIDYLVGLSDVRRPITHSDLSLDELELLSEYRSANKVEREKIKAYMAGLLAEMMLAGDTMILKRVKDLREDNDWTQRHVAGLLHISRSTYSAYENGANAIPLEILKKLALIYGTSADYLMGLTDEPTPYRRKS